MKTQKPPNDLPGAFADLVAGLVYTHNRANANTSEVHHASATLHAVVEMLIERGLLDRAELDARRKAAADALRKVYIGKGMAVAMQDFNVSKYEFTGGAEIDCASRMHLCGAACCKLPVALSKEDVREGTVRRELAEPYMLAHDEDGYCVHMDRETCGCTVYARRPIPCRGYDCRNDSRIWLDFAAGVINPRIAEPGWPLAVGQDGSTAGAG